MFRKIGKFKLAGVNLNEDLLPEIKKIMAQVIVTRCEHTYHDDMFEYIAMSDAFDEVPVGECIPSYDVYITEGSVVFRRL